MIILRKEQNEAFEKDGWRRFEDEMLAHLKGYAPPACEILGDDQVRTVIRFGLERAKQHGFTNRGPLRFYLDLIFLLGCDFDTDPLLPWAGQILNNPADQMQRADHLHERTIEYVEAITGPDGKYEIAALRRAVAQPLDVPAVADRKFKQEVVELLRTIYPEKCEYVGEAAIRTLIPHGVKLAESHSVTSDFGVVLFIGLMFAMGHGFANDPKFPFIEAALNDPSVSDPNERVHQIYSTLKGLYEQFLVYLEKG